MQKKLWWVVAAVCASWACSDDGSGGGGQACPEGTAPGAQLQCLCDDAGATGVTVCQDNGTLGDCDCSGGGAGGTGGTGGGAPAGGTGGTSGGTSGGGSGGTGGSDDDAGVEPTTDAGDVGPGPIVLPDDGDQGSVCSDDRDCNQGFGCFDSGTTGQGFCSATCEDSTDCESLAGAEYTCSMTLGVCQIECTGVDDTASCPEPMECVSTNIGFPGPGQGGGGQSFRCKYPDNLGGGTAQQWEACGGPSDCAEGLICVPSGLDADTDGYCSTQCTMNGGECDALSGGSLDATCAMGLGPAEPARCVLDCSEDADGCPANMECIDYTFFQRCGYP